MVTALVGAVLHCLSTVQCRFRSIAIDFYFKINCFRLSVDSCSTTCGSPMLRPAPDPVPIPFLCASRKLCYGNYTLRLFFIGCHRQRQRQLRWLPTLLLLIRSQRSSGQLLRIASRMKTDIDDRLNPQAPPPVPLHMARLLKNFI